MLLDALRDTLERGEFEDDGWIAVRVSRWQGDDLSLELEVRPGGDSPHQSWAVICRAVRSSKIVHHVDDSLDLLDEHVLLLPHQQIHDHLYISSAPANAHAAVGDLWLAHRAATGGWFEPETFLNCEVPVLKLLESGSGLLATGPRSILDAYEVVLRSHQVAASRVRAHDPVRWHRGNWVPESEVLRVLVVGRSFVVAEAFMFSRGPDSGPGLVV